MRKAQFVRIKAIGWYKKFLPTQKCLLFSERLLTFCVLSLSYSGKYLSFLLFFSIFWPWRQFLVAYWLYFNHKGGGTPSYCFPISLPVAFGGNVYLIQTNKHYWQIQNTTLMYFATEPSRWCDRLYFPKMSATASFIPHAVLTMWPWHSSHLVVRSVSHLFTTGLRNCCHQQGMA